MAALGTVLFSDRCPEAALQRSRLGGRPVATTAGTGCQPLRLRAPYRAPRLVICGDELYCCHRKWTLDYKHGSSGSRSCRKNKRSRKMLLNPKGLH
ncbi:MRPL52 isoform 12 [Pan troglodytes]|uniref:MRPL52 isoform 12 n=1 Tax=Pan troglodytes TaxID=9598 RepID=A0A2J8QJP8_PANTR|nr:MRPL52 isoform 12 [Pan troglodytes]